MSVHALRPQQPVVRDLDTLGLEIDPATRALLERAAADAGITFDAMVVQVLQSGMAKQERGKLRAV